MSLLTSYKVKGVELNDVTNYTVPRQGTSFDDRNASTGEYAYRKGEVPVLTGVTIKEGVLALPIFINARTAAEWKTRLHTLKTIFNTADTTPFKLERKRPSDSVYSFLMVTVREFTVNEGQHQVIVTLETADRAWTEPAWLQSSITLWETSSRVEDLTINYEGATPVEPVVVFQLLTEGQDGPRPLYYHHVTVYTQGAAKLVNTPLLLIDNWNTSGMVSDSEIRADGLDIEVEFLSGQDIQRFVCGTAADRRVWIRPTAWPWRFDVTLAAPPDWNPLQDPADPMLSSTDTAAYITVQPGAKPDVNGFTNEFPGAGTFMVDGEIISYNGVQWLNADMTVAKLTLTARGVAGGTAAANHYEYRRVLFPTTLVVRYGYPPGYEHLMTRNELWQWPLINYDQSTNSVWVQTEQYTPYVGMTPYYQLGWGAWEKKETTNDKRYVGEAIYGLSMYGAQAVNRIAKMKLTGQNTGNWGTVAIPRLWNRLACRFFGGRDKGRVFSYVRCYPKLVTAAGKRVTCRVKAVRSNFGTYVAGGADGRTLISQEAQEILWTQHHTGATQTQYDSGWLWTGMWSQPFEAISVELDHIPAGQPTAMENLVLEKVEWMLDAEYGGSPVALTLGAQNGGSSVYMNVRNLNDTQVGTRFTVNTLMGVDDTVTLDCANRAVAGILLKETTYRNPTWLRLLPGSNIIRFEAPPGIGQVLATIKWQVRN